MTPHSNLHILKVWKKTKQKKAVVLLKSDPCVGMAGLL
jgi:hypothetical protein